jgi:hypothetical protein
MIARISTGGLADAGEVRKKSECSDQAGIVRIRLIGAKLVLGEFVDIDEIGPGAIREPIFSHVDAQQLAVARPPECRQAYQR